MVSLKERQVVQIENNQIVITHPDKLLWPLKSVNKLDYFKYLIEISPYILPFLKERDLTVIRYPDGVGKQSFYQKSCPDYAPEFIETHLTEDTNYIVCSNLSTLIWLGNQAAIDLHTPFNKIFSTMPSEIVFDLDPPSKDEFLMSVDAALILKDIFDKLELISYIKTSGNKGLHIYIPLPDNTFTYDEIKPFTKFLADYIVKLHPELFTTERFKKNRGNKLYVDYVQHGAGKTIVAPYSIRGNEDALVATPLFWSEVNSSLRPSIFPMEGMLDRIKIKGDPFAGFVESKGRQDFGRVLKIINGV